MTADPNSTALEQQEAAVVDADLFWLGSDQELVRTVQCPTAVNDEDELGCGTDVEDAMPPPTAQPTRGSRGGSLRPHGVGKGVPAGALMEADLPSIKLKRIPGLVVPTVPAAANALTAAAAGIVKVEPAGGGGANKDSSLDGRGAGRSDSSSSSSRRNRRRRLAALAAFREPDLMEEARAQRLRRKFHEKLGTKADSKYELVAGFHLDEGVILAYRAFRTRVHFELTERRRKILSRYYRTGEQEVLLYVDRSEFEYYSPVPCYQLPLPPAQQTAPASRRPRSEQPSLSGISRLGCCGGAS